MALFNPSISPAVNVREVDLTGGVPNVQSSTGVWAGNFNWGPVEERTLISSEAALASRFTTPNRDNAEDFISAAMFLSYSQSLYVTRVVADDALNAKSAEYRKITDTEYTYTAIGDAGTGAEFYVTSNDDNNGYLVDITNNGTGYSVGDTFDILGLELGGGNGTNDLQIEVTSVSTGSGAITSIDITGTPASDGSNNILIKNFSEFENATGLASDIIARYPGTLGNELKVEIIASDGDFDNWAYASFFDGAPDTNELHMVVVDTTGAFTGVENTLLERYSFVSTTTTQIEGKSNFIKDVVNRNSQYVYLNEDNSFDPTALQDLTVYNLTKGSNGSAVSTAEYITAFDLYNDTNTVTVDFLIAPNMATRDAQTTVTNHLVTIAESQRKDCVVVSSTSSSDFDPANTSTIVTNVVTSAQEFTKSTYLIIDGNQLKVYDKYNDRYINIAPASSTAGLMAATDLNVAPWYSPAGQRRGRYFGITSIRFSPDQDQRDQLYKVNVNPIANIPGQGVMLYGDKTNSNRPSAFDRINVRRLFLVLERAISEAAKNVIFELNDEFTRAEFVNIVEPLLREVQGRRGITDFRVIADETNNTPEVIDRNEFIANIFIKPTRSINYVTLNFVAVRTGVSFEEVAGAV